MDCGPSPGPILTPRTVGVRPDSGRFGLDVLRWPLLARCVSEGGAARRDFWMARQAGGPAGTGPLIAVLLVGVLRVLAAAGDEADAVPLVLERGAEVLPAAVHALGLAGRQRRRETRLEREIVLASKEQGGVRPPLCRPLVRVAFVVYVNPVAARIRIAGGVAEEAGGCNTRVGREVHSVSRPSVRLAGRQGTSKVGRAQWPRSCRQIGQILHIQCRPLGGRGYGDNRKCVTTATMWLAHAVARECSLRGQHSTLNYRWRHSNVSRVVLP